MHTQNSVSVWLKLFPSFASRTSVKRIAIFGLPFSPNLGDVLIAESLRDEIQAQFPDATVTNFDLFGRTSQPKRLWLRRWILRALLLLPSVIRPWVVYAVVRLQTRSRTMEFLCDIDFAIIGGGQLLRDNSLYVPLLLHHLTRRLQQYKKPYAIFSCGVSPGWSPKATQLFREVLTNPYNRLTAIRDPHSLDLLSRLLPQIPATLAPDPAFLYSSSRSRGPASSREPSSEQAGPRTAIGLGLISPHILQYYGNHWTRSELTRFESHCVSLALTLAREDYDVTLFTDGSPEDHAFAERVYFAIRNRADATDLHRIHLAPRCTNTCDFIALISRMDALIAYRMHAHIVAFAHTIPSVILGWDAKLAGFVTLTHASARYIPDHLAAPERIIRTTRAAMHSRNYALLETIQLQTRYSILDLFSVTPCLRGSSPPISSISSMNLFPF